MSGPESEDPTQLDGADENEVVETQPDGEEPADETPAEVPALVLRSKATGVMVGEKAPGGDPDFVIDEYPIVTDTGGYHAQVRQMAHEQVIADFKEIEQKRALANYQLSQIIAFMRETQMKKTVDRALHHYELVEQIAALYKTFEDVVRKMRAIMKRFMVPLAVDTATGLPVLNTDNTAMLKGKMSQAELDLAYAGTLDKPKHGPSQLIIAPDHEMIGLVEELNKNENFFEDPSNAMMVLNVVSTYVNSVLKCTKIGVASTMYFTSERVKEMSGVAGSLHEQAEAAEVFAFEHDEETLNTWYEFLIQIELTFAEAVIRLEKIYGENLNFLVGNLDSSKVAKLLSIHKLNRTQLIEQIDSDRKALEARSDWLALSPVKRLITPEPPKPLNTMGKLDQVCKKLDEEVQQLAALVKAVREAEEKK